MPAPAPASTATAPPNLATATPAPNETAVETASPPPTTIAATPALTPSAAPQPLDPFALISQDSLFAFLADLTAIQPYSGWRNSATEGEREALDYVARKLAGWAYLQSLGLEVERQRFHAFMATELWESRLQLRVDGREVEVPANGLRGDRDSIALALRFDSDGQLNDRERNPVVVDRPVLLVDSAEQIRGLQPAEAQGRIVFLDYAVIDRTTLGVYPATGNAYPLLAKGPAGLVLVTRFSNAIGESHGAFVGDVNALTLLSGVRNPPTLYVRLEDLGAAGINSWADLARIESARLTWDADVLSPALSGNLVARIPGADPSRAVILGAHIDSPNSPGALDDGSGSAILLEIARVLNVARVQPPIDLYLVWFGSEELGLYGSCHFVATRQELLDRAVAMLQVDMLSRPLDGIEAQLTLETWPYSRLGDSRLPWPDYLQRQAALQGIETVPLASYDILSDHCAFSGLDVPNANLAYANGPAMEQAGGLHYGAHIHDPYDTVELARDVAQVYEQMARVALAAALGAAEAPNLRVTPRPDRRALFVASHTEAVHLGPTTFTDLGLALAMAGYDVDMIPYGQPLTAAELQDTELVIVLPVLDYPSPEGDPNLYDEAWREAEVAALEQHVANGGLLVLTNSAYRLKYLNRILDANEDRGDANILAARFGVAYREGSVMGGEARIEGHNPLVEGVTSLALIAGNGVPFTLNGGEVLAWSGDQPVAALLDHGQGQVLVLADVGLLGSSGGTPANLRFWQNLARYAADRSP